MSNQYADDIRRRQRLEAEQEAALRAVVTELIPPSAIYETFDQRLAALKWEQRLKRRRQRGSDRRRARLAAATVNGRVDRHEIILRDKSTCWICGQKCEPHEIHLDHVIPLSKGGEHSPENVRVAHDRCNLAKRDLLPSDLPSYTQSRSA